MGGMTGVSRPGYSLIELTGSDVVWRSMHAAMPAGMTHEEHVRQMQKDEALKLVHGS
jgi:hypothetical protein